MIEALVLHSVSYSGSWGQARLTVEQFVDKAAELGFDGVMLMAKRPHLSVLDWPPAARARLRSQIEKRGLRAACVAGYTNFTADLEHGDIPTREFQIRHVIELAEMARDLGASLVRVFTGYENAAVSGNAQMRLVTDSLRECAQRAAEFGVTIGIQNHHDLACDYRSMRELIVEIGEPNCRAMFDAWSPALQGENIGRAASAMGGFTAFTTIANYELRPRYRYHPAEVNYESLLPAVQAVPIDEGFIEYPTFLRSLVEGGFHGPAAYEMCSPLRGGGSVENLDSCARRFIEYMHKLEVCAPPRARVSDAG